MITGVNMKILILIALLVTGFLTSTAAAGENLPLYNLSVSFDIPNNLLEGNSTITLPENGEMNISTGNLEIISVKLNGLPLEPRIRDGVFTVKGRGTLEIFFKGKFGVNGNENPENAGVVTNDIISDAGISLTGAWYPRTGNMAYYNLKALLPDGFNAVSEADEITQIHKAQGIEYSFNFPHPRDGINLAAGKYSVLKETFRGIDIYVYFFPEDITHDIIGYFGDISRAETYANYTKKYLAMYEKLIGPYPYRRFSVVENVLPTGYSMPTFTLLGGDVMRLPFIVETSLGHEILHQWFGNYVYDDLEKGNWIEGLTTYQSDYLYQKQKGEGEQYRKKLLVDYQSYVKPDKETQLADFFERTDFASAAIGYGKGMMLFHMLDNEIGDDAFNRGLNWLIKERAFREATWDDVRMAFENASGRNLTWFFDQWLYRKGEISLEIQDPRVTVLNGIPTTSFKVIQNGGNYEFNLLLQINTDKGEITKILKMKNENETFEISTNGTPHELIFDGGYDLMRQLPEKEYPPVIAGLLGDEQKLVVIPEKDREKYEGLINVFQSEGFIPKQEKEISDENLTASSVLVPGNDSPVIKRLFGTWRSPGPGFSLTVRKNPLNASKVVAIAEGDSKKEVDLATGKIFHYGQYSYLRFEKGTNVEKRTDETEHGIRVGLYEPVLGIQPRTTINLDEIVRNISNKTIIYIGETHTSYEDHKVQLAVIMGLYEKGGKFAIGMEMFQKPFQKALDDYIAGNITERELLKKSQYFRRWGYDYNLYREIIEFAKAKNIPLVALNLRSEIIDNVTKGGLDILTPEQKKEIPEDMDMSDENYRKSLEDIFGQHGNPGSNNFNYFYQSQILWDETMAHSVDDFLKHNPDYHIVVLAGSGHIMYGSGIPKRAYRLNARDYATLIQNPDSIEEDAGSFVLFPKPVSLLPVPRLGITLNETGGRVKIENVEDGGAGDRAGLKEGDILLSIDNWKIEAIDDIRISMFDKKEGNIIKINILRKSPAGDQELEINATL
ncbi:Tricorn protease-interacting factor F3 [uncultured archaeon]|nr:Tricorn protease-interacting factor F3 [uncultured archaeon]